MSLPFLMPPPPTDTQRPVAHEAADPPTGALPAPASPPAAPPRKTSSSRVSLFGQVLGVNTVIILCTVLVASVAANLDLHTAEDLKSFLVAIAAILITALVNGWILRRRFRPLERLIHALDAVDLERPKIDTRPERGEPADVELLRHSVEGMLTRLDFERRRRAGAVIDAQEAERARIARDLHDEVNQSLTGIMLRLSALAADSDPVTRAALQDIRDLTDQAMSELLRLSHDLRPTALDDLGLSAALRAQLREIESATALAVDGKITTALPDLSADQQIVIFRIAQEALSNVVQHAAAQAVHLSLQAHGPHGVVLRISDDGHGLPPAGGRHFGARDQTGMTGMRERATLIGGVLDVRSGPAGTTIELTL